MANDRVTELTLLNWVNTFPLVTKVGSIGDLSDGTVLSKMLEDINSDYAVQFLEQNIGPSKWISNKKKLEAVYKSLLRYIGEKCPNLDSVAFESRVDLNAIAGQDDPQETIKLLTIFLMAAVEGPKNRDYINLITTKLSTPAQEEIKKVILHAKSLGPETTKHGVRSATPKTDPILALEEKHVALYAEYDNLKKKHADFMTRFERLTISHDDLIQHSNDTDSQLKSLQESKDGDHTIFIKKQMERIQELEEIIAGQEQELEADRIIKEKQTRELTTLRPLTIRLTQYQDELKELKEKNLNLTKKANKVEHYLKKLENHTSLQRENAELREKIDLLEENQKDYDKVFEENSRYKKTAIEYSSRFQDQELHIVEISSQKNALKQEVQILNSKISDLNERQQHDEKFINDLQEQLRISSGQLCSDPLTMGKRGLSLEEELEQVEDIPNLALENSRLKAEIKSIQNNTTDSEVVQLNIDLAESERARKQLEERYKELFEKYMTEQQQLNALSKIAPAKKIESIANTRKLYLETSQELTATKSKLAQLQSESSARDREAFEKNQAVAALLSNGILTLNDKISVINDHIKFLEEHALQNQHCEPQTKESMSHHLEDKSKTAQENLSDKQKASEIFTTNEIMLRNLTRENALLTTAWYDLTNRIQSNHVVLQRRQDVPKSWLNKQRQIVNPIGRR
ncbi:putative m protein repeat protein [Erysiphe neolycopersici]|uniref:Putative m protein repeat protein n=1 Tax=Erysiphe neolycopersici TaxID=212602 RepID=A0A420I2E4_9PEZI|nr:putative m protein repeat protein [Erysiphe neolycopersici]